MPDNLAIIAYYAWIALGSVSIGYLVLRITVPEVRTRTEEEKLGASAVLGALIAVLAMVLDGALFGWAEFNAVHGFTVSLVVLTTVLAFALLKLYVISFPPKFLTVGVPLSPKPLVREKPGEAEPVFEKI